MIWLKSDININASQIVGYLIRFKDDLHDNDNPSVPFGKEYA